MSKKNKQLTNAILLVLSAGIFILIGYRTDWDKTFSVINGANFFWVAMSICFMLTAHWIRGFRWSLLTSAAGYKLNSRRSFYSVMSGYLVNVATSRGGEIVRCALTAKSERAPVELLIGTVVTERIIDVLMTLIVGLLALLLQFRYVIGFFNTYVFEPLGEKLNPMSIVWISAFLIACVVAIVIYKKKKKTLEKQHGFFQKLIIKFSDGLGSVFKLKKPMLFIFLTFSIWACYLFGTYCTLQSLEITRQLGFFSTFSVLIFSTVGIAIPLPAGAGVWGAMSFGLATVYHLNTSDAETFGIFSMTLSNLSMILFGALSYFLLFFELQKQKTNDS